MKKMPKKLTKEQFIEKSKKIHGDKYDYSLVEYTNNSTKIKIICKKHGIFEQRPINHTILKQGCRKCSSEKQSKRQQYTIDVFIKKSKKIHGNKYDYSLVNYINSNTKVKIICPEHGEFIQVPYDHIRGVGCSYCANNILTKDDFIKKSKKIHGNKYDYSLVNYINSKTKIKIICKKHGVFEQKPNDHLCLHGCPQCNESKGEKEIKKILEQNNIKYISQKKFKGCKYKKPLLFDFYLPDYNTCIEYDGEQHFKSKDYWGGIKNLQNIQKRDKIKNNYCKNNNIKLIRIKYTENIFKKIKLFLIK